MVCLKHSFIHTSIYLQHGSDIKIQIQTHTKYNNHKGKRSTGYITDILVSWLSRLNFCLLKKKRGVGVVVVTQTDTYVLRHNSTHFQLFSGAVWVFQSKKKKSKTEFSLMHTHQPDSSI